MKTSHIPALTLALVLAACGGGDGPSAPTPTPTPTATATPTPTPTPTPTYTPFAAIDTDTTFETSCLGYDYANGLSEITDPSFGNGLDISYKAADESYTVELTPLSLIFGPGDKDTTSSDPITYRAATSEYTAALTLLAAGADYVRIVNLVGVKPNASYRCALGVPTQRDDLPAANTTYSVLAVDGLGNIEGQNYEFSSSTAVLTYDPATKGLEITINRSGTKNDGSGDTNVYSLGTLATDSPLVLSGSSFNGSIYSATPERFEGVVGGSLFGPQGSEAGLVLSISGRTSTGVEYGVNLGLSANAD